MFYNIKIESLFVFPLLRIIDIYINYTYMAELRQDKTWSFVLNSAETKIYPVHKCSICQQLLAIVGILTFISRTNYMQALVI